MVFSEDAVHSDFISNSAVSKYLHTSHFSSLGQLLGSKVLETDDNARNAVNDTESAILSSSILEEFSFLLVRPLLDVD